ncbi:MAG TPA: endolytic transglycosylase MltG [Clostridiales bacterium]|nr:endolytic transglycosylase MltG [Clostridiales bacterium]
MAEEMEKINAIFRLHEEKEKTASQKKIEDSALHTAASTTGKTGSARMQQASEEPVDPNDYDEEDLTERDFQPVRRSREYHSGCLGGVMYFVFIACVSIILACVAWMSAADALALNKDLFTAEVSLPSDIFTSKTVEILDEKGNVTGTKRVSSADINYVADELKSAGLIQYKWLFKLFCKVSKADTKIEPGEYELRSSYDYRALVGKMRKNSGAAATVSVTIPEGYTMSQIFYRLEENGVCSYDELMEAAANENFEYSFLSGLEPGDPSRLEGFLFPDTYEFYKSMSAPSAINKFLQNFYGKLNADVEKQISDRGLTLRQVLEIASLIEREAANDEERPLIAAVIYNRIRNGWTLGLESSILYMHQDHEGAPTAEMLAEESPYNLMINTGLPPTPICNPGMSSINAALVPANTNDFFFTLDTATGTHRFFETMDQFNAFVATQDYGGEG